MKKASTRKSRAPSRASLLEMPEVDFSKARVRGNPYAHRIASEGVTVQVGRGRPKKGSETGPTVPRSVRFPVDVWKQLERRAKVEGLTLHAAIRSAVLTWLGDGGARR